MGEVDTLFNFKEGQLDASIIASRFSFLLENSSYHSDFDISVYKFWFDKVSNNVKHPNLIYREPFQLINKFIGCQNCHQGFQLDPYGYGCTHDCLYCFARTYALKNSFWNESLPVPIDISEFLYAFYTCLETENEHPWRQLIESRTPLRLGGNSDPFMHLDRKFGIAKEILKILNHYNYPYMIVTRSDLLAEPDYLNHLRPDLCSVHISIPSKNNNLLKVLEPGAPSFERRIRLLNTLNSHGIWCTVRINPLFPVFKNGYLSSGGDPLDEKNIKCDFFSFDLLDDLKKANCKSILIGMVNLDLEVAQMLSQKMEIDLLDLFDSKNLKKGMQVRLHQEEADRYFMLLAKACREREIDFSTCYLGSNQTNYYRYQNLWSNKNDCCNVKNKVERHNRDTLDSNFSVDANNFNASNSSFLKRLSTKLVLFLMKSLSR